MNCDDHSVAETEVVEVSTGLSHFYTPQTQSITICRVCEQEIEPEDTRDLKEDWTYDD